MQLSSQNRVSLFNFPQTQNQPSTPNREKCRCHKNPKWTVPCKIKIFCYDFEFRKMYHVHSTTQNQRYFYAISDVTRYFGSLFWIKSCAICEGLNVLEGPQNGLLFCHRLVYKKVVHFVKDWTFWVTKNLSFLYIFDTDFDFVLKVSRFKIPQMYIYDFCMFTPILVRLRRHTLCECNLVTLTRSLPVHSWSVIA